MAAGRQAARAALGAGGPARAGSPQPRAQASRPHVPLKAFPSCPVRELVANCRQCGDI